MDTGQGTFITGTGDGTVPVVREVLKKKNVVMMKEDILYKRILEYGLVSPAGGAGTMFHTRSSHGGRYYASHLILLRLIRRIRT